MPAGSSALVVTVNGSGFLNTSVIEVNGASETTVYVNSTQLTATVPASQLVSGADLAVVVANGSLTSGSGTPVNLEVDNPVPAITSVSPTSEPTGTTSPNITVTGTGFVPTTVINVNGAARTTTFNSSTQVSVALSAADVSTAGSLSLTAVNTKPGGGTSTAVAIAIVAPNPVPTVSALNPATELVGTESANLVVAGTGFVSSTVINVNGSARPTGFTSSTQVSVTLTAADLSATGSLSLTAVNPAPGGGTSAAITLPVNNPSVGPIQLNPSTVAVGSASPTTITVTGNTFVANSAVKVNGNARSTTYVNSTTLNFVATVADQADSGTLAVTVTNPVPGGGTSPVANLTVGTGTATPVITSVSPNSIVIGSSDTPIVVSGTGFTPSSVVQWNGVSLNTSLGYYGGSALFATVPAADLTAAGTVTVKVNTPSATPSLSNGLTVTITNPPVPTLTSISPSAGPINTATAVNLSGAGFTAQTTVAINGVAIASDFVSSTQLTISIPAAMVATPGNASITVTTPAPGGGTSAAQTYTAYLAITNNDIVYNAADGLLYASVPVSGVATGGNTVVGIDPTTGNMTRQIWVGSKPNKLALSTDGKQLFVGLDGAAAVAQVDLTSGTVVNQFSLGGGPGIYNPPSTAISLAALPGSPNSVAVAGTGGVGNGAGVTIYDSGVARTNHSSVGAGPLSFGSSGSTLYLLSGSSVEKLTVDSTGITATTTLASVAYTVTSLQYDNGRLYLSNGQVLDASTGSLLGTFYSNATTAANGPVVSDSTLGRAFIGQTYFSASGQVLAFDESTFNQNGSIPVNGIGVQGYPTNFQKIVLWGQNGIALSAAPSAFSFTNQIFIFQSPLVKDLSSLPADLSVTLTAPSTATTGTAISWTATVSNEGPNQADGVTLALNLDSSLIINSVTPSQGSCGTGTAFLCDVGNLAKGASVTVKVSATPSNSGTLVGVAAISSTSYDPVATNNQASTSTTVTGSLYSTVPSITGISPNLVQAGTADFTLTVTGTGFNADSVVNLGANALSTTYVSATQLTAAVSAADIANYGWTPITASNPSPGGGVSQILPLTIYDVVNVPASGILFDPFSQLLYTTVPSTATNLTGNSVVTINPMTGAVGTPLLVGSQPTVMAETSDGNYLYISLSGANSLAQFDLLHQNLKATIPLNLTQNNSATSVTANSLAAMPGNYTTLAVGVTNGWNNFGIFDISGNTGSFRPNLSGIYNGVNPVFADASHLFAYDSQTSGAEFYRYSVESNGLTEIDGTTLNGLGGFSGSIQFVNGLVYGAGGGIINPATTPPSQVATLPLVDFYGSGVSGEGDGFVADPSLQKEFLMLENIAGTSAYGLTRYDLTTYAPETLLNLPQSLDTYGGWTILRWGQAGLALLSSGENYSTNQTSSTLILLRGPFVTPQLLQTATAAHLNSSSTTTITHGAGNTMLTLTGSNFLPGVAVTWNGSYRTTTIVDTTHVTVAIPASDLVSTGTASLVATNPGGPPSTALQIAIN